MSEQTNEIAQVAETLAAHRRFFRIGCRCGHPLAASVMDGDAILAEHEMHVAQMIAGNAGEFDLQDTTSDYFDPESIRAKVERSSLGSPEAVAARATVTDEQAARVVARAKELRTPPGVTA